MKKIALIFLLACTALAQLTGGGGIEYDYWYFDGVTLRSYIDSVFIQKMGLASVGVDTLDVGLLDVAGKAMFSDSITFGGVILGAWPDSSWDSAEIGALTTRDLVLAGSVRNDNWNIAETGSDYGPERYVGMLIPLAGVSFDSVVVSIKNEGARPEPVIMEFWTAYYVTFPVGAWYPSTLIATSQDTATVPPGGYADYSFTFADPVISGGASILFVHGTGSSITVDGGASGTGTVVLGDTTGWSNANMAALNMIAYGDSTVYGSVGLDASEASVDFSNLHASFAKIDTLTVDSLNARAILVDSINATVALVDSMLLGCLQVDSGGTAGFWGYVAPDTLIDASPVGSSIAGGVYNAFDIGAGSFDTVEWYFQENHSADSRYIVILYDDNAGVPGSIVASSDTVTIINGSPAAWTLFTFDDVQTATADEYIGIKSIDSGNINLYRYTLLGSSYYLFYSGSWHKTTGQVFNAKVYLAGGDTLHDMLWDNTSQELDMPDIDVDNADISTLSIDDVTGLIRYLYSDYTITTSSPRTLVVKDTLNILAPAIADAYEVITADSLGRGYEWFIKLIADVPCTVSVAGGAANLDGDSVFVMTQWDDLFIQAVDSLYIVK